MKKSILFGLLALILLPAQAQLTDKLVPHMGFMFQVSILDEANGVFETRPNFYSLHLGTYYTLANTENDVASVGLDGSVSFGFNIPQGRFAYSLQVPVFLMGRVGALSTPYNQQRFGFGAGLGLAVTNLSYISGSSQVLVRNNATGFTPNAMAQVTLSTGGRPLTVRFHISVAQTSSTLTSKFIEGGGGGSIDDTDINFGNWGIGIIYGF